MKFPVTTVCIGPRQPLPCASHLGRTCSWQWHPGGTWGSRGLVHGPRDQVYISSLWSNIGQGQWQSHVSGDSSLGNFKTEGSILAQLGAQLWAGGSGRSGAFALLVPALRLRNHQLHRQKRYHLPNEKGKWRDPKIIVSPTTWAVHCNQFWTGLQSCVSLISL
jgi:hypothetical protein